ncbi:MAG: carboxymuconolactone decarboxylase family protein [Pseudomonadota bacterium]|nr:carboxymuconolactone decarboxylase family protein [Pseudomonadota bacterium]
MAPWNPQNHEKLLGLATAAQNDSRLDAKTKELIATEIAVAVRCGGCIALHVKAAGQSGAYKPHLEPVRLGAG